MSDSVFEYHKDEQGIGWVKFDLPGEKVNTLQAEFAPQISALLDRVESDKPVGVVFYSGKEDNFIAGADIRMLDACDTPEQAKAIVTVGQQLFDRIESMPFPVIAAIDGACLGGGMELALACHGRVCSDSNSTRLGLPEVQLGLLPGSGGTQRLPRLVGLTTALDLLLTGKQLRPQKARKLGLVDDCVPKEILLDVAAQMAASAKPVRKQGKQEWALSGNPLGRYVVFDQARKKLLSKTKGNYPAPEAILNVVKLGLESGFEQGLIEEANAFSQLLMTPESNALRQLFFLTTAQKKTPDDLPAPVDIEHVAVLGGGLMGGGISHVTVSKAGVPVRLKDISEKGILNAMAYHYGLLDKKRRRRIVSRAELESQMMQLSGDTQYRGFANTDMVIEAVFEELALKQQMVEDIERECQPTTIFATNTSSLPISQIAERAAHPENVIGLHYFSPVEKMPLAEIIPHAGTSSQTIASTIAFARRQGKTPIVVKDKAGFYVNRILTPYMNEAATVLLSGMAVERLDKSLVKFGFPVGPLTLLDEVGIDIGAKITPIMASELGERFLPPALFEQLLNDDRKGRKTGKGFYLYNGKKKQVDKQIYSLLNITVSEDINDEDVAMRCVLMMLNEAVLCLDEGVIASPEDGDIGAIFGIGFPPFLGGPFWFMDQYGIDNLVALFDAFHGKYGKRFVAADTLKVMAENGSTFYPDAAKNVAHRHQETAGAEVDDSAELADKSTNSE